MERHIALAYEIAHAAHRGMLRLSGEPYLNHVMRVADAVRPYGDRAVTTAYLHDVVEDTDVTPRTLRALGFPETTVQDVIALTHESNDATYDEYITRLIETGSEYALRVKLADLEDNLRDVDRYAPSLRKRYERARKFVKSALWMDEVVKSALRMDEAPQEQLTAAA